MYGDVDEEKLNRLRVANADKIDELQNNTPGAQLGEGNELDGSPGGRSPIERSRMGTTE